MHVTNSHPLAFFEIGLKLKVLLMWICLGFFFQLFGANGEADRGWLLIKEKNGVKVYEKELDDRIAFRGVGIIQGKPEELVGVLHNPSRWKFWIEDLKEGKLLEQKSKFHFIRTRFQHNTGPIGFVLLSRGPLDHPIQDKGQMARPQMAFNGSLFL